MNERDEKQEKVGEKYDGRGGVSGGIEKRKGRDEEEGLMGGESKEVVGKKGSESKLKDREEGVEIVEKEMQQQEHKSRLDTIYEKQKQKQKQKKGQTELESERQKVDEKVIKKVTEKVIEKVMEKKVVEKVDQKNDSFSPTISINVVHIDYTMMNANDDALITVNNCNNENNNNDNNNYNDDNIFEYYDTPVPVIRIFGSTCQEKRACVHIHGVRTHFVSNVFLSLFVFYLFINFYYFFLYFFINN